MSENERDEWIHISRMAQEFGISLALASQWHKEAPPAHKRKVANVKQVSREYADARLAFRRLERVADLIGEPVSVFPYINVVDEEEEQSPLSELYRILLYWKKSTPPNLWNHVMELELRKHGKANNPLGHMFRQMTREERFYVNGDEDVSA